MSSAVGRGRTLDEAVDAALIQLRESRRNVDVRVISEADEETVVEVTVIGESNAEATAERAPAVPAPASTDAAPASTSAAAAPAGAGPAPVVPGAAGSTAAPNPIAAAATDPAPALSGAAGSPAAAASVAQHSLQQLLGHMGVPGDVTVREAGENIVLDISGRDLGMLIGWRGETLRAIQTVTNIMVSKQVGPERRVVVDVERYRQRRENTVREIAFRAARQVKATGDPITLDAMQPFERRAIHLALEADPDVSTSSVGVEPERRVVVGPRTGPE